MLQIKIGTCIKAGIGFYVGWTIAKEFDRSLGKVLCKNDKVQEILQKSRSSEQTSETNDVKNKNIIGFHA